MIFAKFEMDINIYYHEKTHFYFRIIISCFWIKSNFY